MSATTQDWAIAKALVREWLTEKGVALTGVNGETSRSTVNRFKLHLAHRIVITMVADQFEKPSERFKAGLMAAIREGKPRE
jgi:hypothetical protein